MLLYKSWLIYNVMYSHIAFIAQNDDIEAAEEHEEKSPPDGVVLQFSYKHTSTQIVPQDVNQNSTVANTHICPEDTKL